uniref:Disease resistance protein At4g27190-like leucine-rich repeats domain-containing protein n=1 Tax=Oryza brachyantha TaxID=4533 RepID=J3L0I7_ORYBR
MILEEYLRNTDRPYNQGGQNIYLDGWEGVGASAVLAAVAESARARRKKSTYDIVIHVDCSQWESRRALQKKIAEELKLGGSAMALFGWQDEDDDFSGIAKSSRAELADAAELIFKALKDRSFLLIFHNGSDEEVDFLELGVPVLERRNSVLWTFRGRFRLDPAIRDRVKNAHVFVRVWPESWAFAELLCQEEAAHVSSGISAALITECWLYLSLLYYNNYTFISDDQDVHACNYWVCDGIIAGDSAREIGDRLYQGMQLKYLPAKRNHYMTFNEYLDSKATRHRRWVSVMPKNSDEVENIQTIPLEATSYFLMFQRSDPPKVLPNHLFSQDNNLRVLRLSWCTFIFSSPPFTCCKHLKFILIDSCRDKDVSLTSDGYYEKKGNKWAFLQNLWVLDIRNTNWDWILSSSKMVLMVELRELYLKATGTRLHDQILLDMSCHSNLRMFRVIDSSTYLKVAVHDSLQHIKNLELLDLSGNTTLHVLPNLSGASKLKVLILDGCIGLEVVEPSTLPISLESFSFDGFGPASRWKHSLRMPDNETRPNSDNNQGHPSAISKISLEGCEQLKNVFLRGLPNLEELNLSETGIEALDLEAMLVKRLERLFLLGCEKLVRVKWRDARDPPLKLLCIDTRGKAERSMDGCCQRSHLHSQQDDAAHPSVHVVATDARLLRGFNTRNSSTVFGSEVSSQHLHLHLSATVNESPVLPRGKEEEASCRDGLVHAFPYLDVIDKALNKDGEDGCSVPSCNHLVPQDLHVEIGKGGSNLGLEQDLDGICSLIYNTQSLHIHDNSSIRIGNLGDKTDDQFRNLRWCHVTRCLKMHTVFLSNGCTLDSFMSLETLWVSHLLAAQYIWGRDLCFDEGDRAAAFSRLRCIHLHSCPRLRIVLPWSFPTMDSLETIHITYCSELRQIFPKEQGDWGRDRVARTERIEFPRLRRIHLHELPMLQDVCETPMSAPVLETIELRGCWSLKRLPVQAIHAVVDCEKELWDKLDLDHRFTRRHPRYSKNKLPRGSLLRFCAVSFHAFIMIN